MYDVIEKIKTMEDYDLQKVVFALMDRYSVIHPDYEIAYIAIHKERQQRKQDILGIIQLLRSVEHVSEEDLHLPVSLGN